MYDVCEMETAHIAKELNCQSYLLLTVSKFCDFLYFQGTTTVHVILAILDQYTMILMIFIVIDDVMFYSCGQILTIITNSLKLVPVYNSCLKVIHSIYFSIDLYTVLIFGKHVDLV